MRRLVFVGLLAVMVALLVVPALATDDDNTNSVDHWCDRGIKIEDPGTPFVVPEPKPGYVWTLLVIKAGSGAGENHQVPNPVVGTAYVHPSGKDISHVILCHVDEPDETTTTTSSTTSTSTSTSTTTTSTTQPETTTTVPETTTTVPETTTTVPETTTTVADTTTTTLPGATTTEPPPNGGVPAGGGAMAPGEVDPLIAGGTALLALAGLVGLTGWTMKKRD